MNFIIKYLNENTLNKINYIFSFRFYNEFKKYKTKKKIIHILTPLHGNMGDQAIVYATNKYLRDNFKDYNILEIYRRDIYKYMKSLKKAVNPEDLIVLIGGGNMGNLWINEEVDRRFVIKNFPNNKIISMPQTISFTSDSDGDMELAKTKNIYNKNNNLILISREKKSYKLMQEYFEDKDIKLNPDTVLYLNNTVDTNKYKREYIMTCLRNDKEGILGNKKDVLINKLKNEFGQVVEYDTVVNKTIFKEQREKELNDMFDKFLKAKMVITDRLHGMVFCVITKTPCIVTKSIDHKVTGTYEWIEDLNYIKLVDDLDFNKIELLIEELSNIDKLNDIDFKEKYFNKLTNTLKELLMA
ncbi:polysaccharide pyruvyl transferase family protein [Clostridium saudiense]|uniref:polysaccharide pyruvyl transferase family protein n=1 Tax=Clostridium saudiense TaxID=1414720 RepID=UPI001FAE3F73|nr:polysaccharide pyruvyl transferase family protein [Clostridium saudiense]